MKQVFKVVIILFLMGTIGCSTRSSEDGRVVQHTMLPQNWLRIAKDGDGVPLRNGGRYFQIPDDQVDGLPQMRVTVVAIQPCRLFLKTTDGRYLCIGGPASRFGIWNFLKTVKEGQTFLLPEEFSKALDEYKRQTEKPNKGVHSIPESRASASSRNE